MEIDSDVVINFVHFQYDTHAFPIGFIAALHHPLNRHVTPVAAALSTLELMHHPGEGGMAPVLDLYPAIEPAAARYGLSRCLETNPSNPIRQACLNRSGPISSCANGAPGTPPHTA